MHGRLSPQCQEHPDEELPASGGEARRSDPSRVEGVRDLPRWRRPRWGPFQHRIPAIDAAVAAPSVGDGATRDRRRRDARNARAPVPLPRGDRLAAALVAAPRRTGADELRGALGGRGATRDGRLLGRHRHFGRRAGGRSHPRSAGAVSERIIVHAPACESADRSAARGVLAKVVEGRLGDLEAPLGFPPFPDRPALGRTHHDSARDAAGREFHEPALAASFVARPRWNAGRTGSDATGDGSGRDWINAYTDRCRGRSPRPIGQCGISPSAPGRSRWGTSPRPSSTWPPPPT